MDQLKYSEKPGVFSPSSTGSQHFQDWPNDAGFNSETEELTPVELVVTGFIPAAAAGILYRTGPGHYKINDDRGNEHKVSHWFDGFTQVHRFQLISTPEGSCRVIYNSRRQVDKLLENFRKTGRLTGITFGQKRDPCMSIFQKIKCVFETSLPDDPLIANVGVTICPNIPILPANVLRQVGDSPKGLRQPRSLTFLTDTNQAKHIDPETLQPIGVTKQHKLHPELKGPLSCAHAAFDPITGDFFNYNLDFGMKATYRVFKTSPSTMQTEILATITGFDVNPAYIHSFFLSADYVVLCVWPCVLAAGGARVLWERNMMDAMYFDHNLLTKWYVVDRKRGRGLVATFECEAFFAFHTVNAYQEDGGNFIVDIICEIIQYPSTDIIHRGFYDNLTSTGPGVGRFAGNPDLQPSFARYRLAGIPQDGTTQVTPATAPLIAQLELKILSPVVGDLPCINPRYACKMTRYLYTNVDRGLSSFYDGIAKLDLETKDVTYWGCDKHTPGEVIFIPDGADNREDSGYLLTVVLNGETGTSYLLCLDARHMTELGRAAYNGVIPFGSHGAHFPAMDMSGNT